MSDRDQFLARRQTGIGGSDVGAIVGVDPRRTALDVYLEKVGEATEEGPPNKFLERGRRLEPIVMDMYFEYSGRRKKRAQFRRHREHKWLIGHPDALIRGKEKPETLYDRAGVLECKTMAYRILKKATERGLPEQYQLQAQHYMALCNHPWAAFALLHPDTFSFAVVEVEAQPEIQKQMIEICEHFWFNHVVPRRPPPAKEPEWKIELPAVEGIVEDRRDDQWRELIEREAELRAMKDEASALYETARQELKDACGRFGVFEGAGARVYFKQREGRKSLNRKNVEAAGLIDPVKLASWAAETEEDYPGVLAMLQAQAPELRVDVEQLLTAGKPYEDLRIYHLREED